MKASISIRFPLLVHLALAFLLISTLLIFIPGLEVFTPTIKIFTFYFWLLFVWFFIILEKLRQILIQHPPIALSPLTNPASVAEEQPTVPEVLKPGRSVSKKGTKTKKPSFWQSKITKFKTWLGQSMTKLHSAIQRVVTMAKQIPVAGSKGIRDVVQVLVSTALMSRKYWVGIILCLWLISILVSTINAKNIQLALWGGAPDYEGFVFWMALFMTFLSSSWLARRRPNWAIDLPRIILIVLLVNILLGLTKLGHFPISDILKFQFTGQIPATSIIRESYELLLLTGLPLGMMLLAGTKRKLLLCLYPPIIMLGYYVLHQIGSFGGWLAWGMLASILLMYLNSPEQWRIGQLLSIFGLTIYTMLLFIFRLDLLDPGWGIIWVVALISYGLAPWKNLPDKLAEMLIWSVMMLLQFLLWAPNLMWFLLPAVIVLLPMAKIKKRLWFLIFLFTCSMIYPVILSILNHNAYPEQNQRYTIADLREEMGAAQWPMVNSWLHDGGLWGTGPDSLSINLPYYRQKLRQISTHDYPDNLHCGLLEMRLMLGLPATILFYLMLITLLIVNSSRILRDRNMEKLSYLTAGLIFIVYSIFNTITLSGYLVMFLIIGVLDGVSVKQEP